MKMEAHANRGLSCLLKRLMLCVAEKVELAVMIRYAPVCWHGDFCCSLVLFCDLIP